MGEVMQWLVSIVGLVGTLGGITGFIAIYKAKPEKRAREIENLVQVIKTEKESSEAYRKEAGEMIERLRERVELVEKRNRIYTHAIMAAYKCSAASLEECPVWNTMSDLCNLNEGVCEVKTK